MLEGLEFKPFANNTVKSLTTNDLSKSFHVAPIGKTAGTKNFMSKNAGTISSIGNAVSSITGAMSNMNGSISAEAGAAREGMRSAIGQFGPWGAAIAAASGIVDSITDATGISWNTIDKNDASRAGIGKGAVAANNILASIPGNSIWGAVLGKTKQAQKSVYIDQMANSYGGSVQDINSAMNLSGKRAFGVGKMNSFIDEQNRVNNLITNIAMQSELAKNNNAAELYQQQNFNKYSGYTPQLLLAKKGSKIPELEVARDLIGKWTPKQRTAVDLNSLMYDISTLFNGKDAATNVSSSVMQFLSDIQNGIDEKDISTLVTNSLADASKNTDSIGIKVVNTISENKDKLIDLFNQHGYNTEVFNDINNLQSIQYIGNCISELLGTRSFKSGGKLDMNIIPEGALHKNKHHLEEVNPELEGTITEKGIPVITEDGEQKAEIERDEMVVNALVTKQLEEYYDQYNNSKDDSIAIECGKFLVEEILKRTEDRTGLLKTVTDE